jgi:hypothetical protein
MDPDADSGEAQKHTNPDAAPDREHCFKAISRQVNQMSVGALQKQQIQQNLLLCKMLIQK